MKICSKCNILKSTNDFSQELRVHSLLKSKCKECYNKYGRLYSKSINGLITKIYHNQKQSSYIRGHNPPEYTKQELKIWILSQENFEELYNNWKNSGYNKDLIPSIDRKDDYIGYNFSNIQLIIWEANRRKSYNDRKNGINNKNSKKIKGINKDTGQSVFFYSIHKAERYTGIHNSNICSCCKGQRKTAGGYIWTYI